MSRVEDPIGFENFTDMLMTLEEFKSLTSLIDNGDSDGLNDDILSDKLSASEKVDLLNEASPYISEGVLSVVITEIFDQISEDDLKGVLLENSPLASGNLVELEEIEWYFSSQNFNELMDAQTSSPSELDLLQMEMTEYANQYSYHKSNLINFVLLDSSIQTNRYQLLFDYFDQIESEDVEHLDRFWALNRVVLKRSLGDFEGANDILDTTTGWFEFSEKEKEVFDMIDLQADTTQDSTLDSLTVAMYAFDSTLINYTYAMALLDEISDYKYEISLGELQSPSGKRNELTFSEKDKSVDSKLNVYPNPSSGLLNIELNSANETQITSVEVFNTTGTRVYSVGRVNNSIEKIDLSGLPKGVYFIQSKLTDGSTVVDKVVLSD